MLMFLLQLMSWYRSLPLSLLVTLLFFSSTSFFYFSHATPHSLQAQPPSGNKYEAKYFLESIWVTERPVVVVEAPFGEPVETPSSVVLAAQRTYRKDPLNGFKRYTGGWNIKEHHYWASVGFTAAPLFVVALIWFLGFGLCLSLICLFHFCCKRQSYGYSRVAYALSLIFLIIFTVAAIIGCVVLYTGQEKFHKSTTQTLEYVVSQADMTVDKLRNISDNLAAAKQLGIDNVFLPSNVQTDIDQIESKINSSASNVAEKTAENKDDMQDLLDSVRLALIVIAAIMLVLTFLGFLFSIFGMQLLVYILVVLGWILVAGTFILCGTFLILHNVAADTCVAMEEWVQNPTVHTTLDDILPCVDSATAQETVSRSKEVTYQFVEVINSVITNVSNLNFSPNFKPMYFNQSGPLLPILCNPFHPDLTERTCTDGEVELSNATQVLSGYVCQVSPAGICVTTGRLTPDFYNQMTTAVTLCNGLINYSPFLAELQDCTFARETFSDIYVYHCPGLRQYSRWIYVGLVMVSTAVMLSLIFWVIYGRERRHRLQTKLLSKDRGLSKKNEGPELGKSS